MAATSSHGHVRKRRFQPSITSYFNGDGTRSQTSGSPLSPPLPAETQASLMSVGMRVRKSVPEGYKTHKTLGIDGFPFPSTAPSRTSASARSSYGSQESARELMPFCGLHKVGGLGMQPQGYLPPSSAPPAMQSEAIEERDGDMPGLSSTQGTTPSTQGSSASFPPSRAGESRKRTLEEDMEDDMDAFFDEVDGVGSLVTTRPIAKPKCSLRRAATDGMVITSGDDDFEEAVFLAPMDVDTN